MMSIEFGNGFVNPRIKPSLNWREYPIPSVINRENYPKEIYRYGLFLEKKGSRWVFAAAFCRKNPK
jgi:hypothetical protein